MGELPSGGISVGVVIPSGVKVIVGVSAGVGKAVRVGFGGDDTGTDGL